MVLKQGTLQREEKRGKKKRHSGPRLEAYRHLMARERRFKPPKETEKENKRGGRNPKGGWDYRNQRC